MPPPRLPRHLRLCHPLRRVHGVRCASRTTRTTPPATSGDEAGARDSETKPPDANGTAPVADQKRGWLRAAIESLPFFGSRQVTAPPAPLPRPGADTVAQNHEPVLRSDQAHPTESGIQRQRQRDSVAQVADTTGGDLPEAHTASEIGTKTSETVTKMSEIAAKTNEIAAKTSEIVAKTSEKATKTSEKVTKTSEEATKMSEKATMASETVQTADGPGQPSKIRKISIGPKEVQTSIREAEDVPGLPIRKYPPVPMPEAKYGQADSTAKAHVATVSAWPNESNAVIARGKGTPAERHTMPDLQQKAAHSPPASGTIKPKKHPQHLPENGPRKALHSLWLRFRLDDLELADQAEKLLPAYFGRRVGARKYQRRQPLQDPRRKALVTMWNFYRHSGRQLNTTVGPLWRLFPEPRRAKPPSLKPPKSVGNCKQDHVDNGSSKLQPERAKPPSFVPPPTHASVIAANPLQSESSRISNNDTPIPPTLNDERSLLEELFPEATISPLPTPPVEKKRDEYPKLQPPAPPLPIHHVAAKVSMSKQERAQRRREEMISSFRRKMEEISVLQLAHCSTELMEVDFLRLIPKGKHIEGWRRGGEFFKIIPGRDPLSLERMPFYYLLFKSSEAALAYQNHAARLHKLSTLHQSIGMLSAVPPPKGFLEDGEDMNQIVQCYNLAPTQHHLHLSMLMQPYSPALRALIERGGYHPIVPDVDAQGQRIWKVLMHIEGYEPSTLDLFKIFNDDAWRQGMPLPLRTESMSSIHRLRDVINLKTSAKTISSVSPRAAYGTAKHATPDATRQGVFEDPVIQHLMEDTSDEGNAKEVNQYVMNRVYNRWVIDFDDEAAAKRFATYWHRRVLPAGMRSRGPWEETEEARRCNTEVLW